MKLDFVNKRGEILPLIGNQKFNLINVDGISNYSADISSTVIGAIDGDLVTNIQAVPRSIVMDLRITGFDVEAKKRYILSIIKPKQKGSLVWEQDERNLTISGYIESIDMPRFNNAVVMQITMHCDKPFWEDVDWVVKQIDEAINLHYFTTLPNEMLYFPVEGIPFGEYDMLRTRGLYNAGDVDVGMEMTIVATDIVHNPIIYNQDGEFFGIGYEGNEFTMQTGDIVVINTSKGNKSIVLNGTTNLFDKVKPMSKWLQLQAGNNSFAIDSDDKKSNNMSFNLTYKRQFV